MPPTPVDASQAIQELAYISELERLVKEFVALRR
jgi:hypothetical protein